MLDIYPKPINPERFALLQALNDDPAVRSMIEHSLVRELVAAHDFQERRAEEAERKLDELADDLDVEFRLRKRATDERNAVQAKLSQLGVSEDLDADVRRHRERMQGLESSTDEYRLRACEDELARALGRGDHDGWNSLIAAVTDSFSPVD